MKYVVCPYCGYEYHPSEIFFPQSVLGRYSAIERNADGTIENIIGDSTDLKETYECDNCNKFFDVTMKMEFECTKKDDIDFDSEYSVPLTKYTK